MTVAIIALAIALPAAILLEYLGWRDRKKTEEEWRKFIDRDR
jgi:hypothetical protein